MRTILALWLIFWASMSFSCFGQDASLFLTMSGQPRVFKKFPIKYKFACDFQDELEEPVRNALNYWQRFSKVKLFEEVKTCTWSDLFMYTSDGGLAFVLEEDHDAYEYQGEGYAQLWAKAPMATYNDEPFAGVIIFYKKWFVTDNDGVRESVARHEIGHFLGFRHTDRQDCLMFKSINDDEEYKEMCLPEIKLFQEYY